MIRIVEIPHTADVSLVIIWLWWVMTEFRRIVKAWREG
jgi:hypothetical protein